MGFFSKPSYLRLRSELFVSERSLGSGVVISYFTSRHLFFFRRIVIVEVKENGRNNWLHDFVKEIKHLHPRTDFISKPQANVVIHGDIDIVSGLKIAPWGSFLKDIDHPDEDLLKSFKGNARRDVNKANQNGIVVKTVSAEVCHSMLEKMFLRQGQPAYVPSLDLLKGFENELSDNVLMLGAFHQGEAQSVVAVPFDDEKGYYLYGASVPKPSRGAMHLLQYEVMRQLRDRGVPEYDFFGARLNLDKNSKIAGIQRFKESFKPRLVEGYSFKVILRPWKYRLFELAVAVYYRLKGAKYEGDAIDQILKEQRGG